MNTRHFILELVIAFGILGFNNLSAQTDQSHPPFSGVITYSCEPVEEEGFAPFEVKVVTHGGQFRITESSESGKSQTFLLLGAAQGSVNQFTFFGTDIALTGPLPKSSIDSQYNSELVSSSNSQIIAGISCIPCGGNNWCAPSLGPSPAGWPGSSLPLIATIIYGDVSYIITATSVVELDPKEFRHNASYGDSFKIDKGRIVVDSKGFVELFQLTPPNEAIRY
ncbi:MAG: hypothetical protein COA49_10035 [Bacteroidetes bacterium]|nr:MAG: hypothetical protein COA49_10035 [Bacteroidota bacterium]